MSPYVNELHPEIGSRATVVGAIGDRMLLVSLFVLGRDFWDKLRALYVTIHAMVPMVSFGWPLLAMGIAQSRPSSTLRTACLAAFALLVVYIEVPWARLIVDTWGA